MSRSSYHLDQNDRPVRPALWTPDKRIVNPQAPPKAELFVGHAGVLVMMVVKIGEKAVTLPLDLEQAVAHAKSVLEATGKVMESIRCQTESRAIDHSGSPATHGTEPTTAPQETETPLASTAPIGGDGSGV